VHPNTNLFPKYRGDHPIPNSAHTKNIAGSLIAIFIAHI